MYEKAGGLNKDCKDVNWEVVKAGKTLYISSVFDLRDWWISVGGSNGSMWRQIYPVVPAIISVPAANGFMERTFSACTNFDNELCQRLNARRFEMAVLLLSMSVSVAKLQVTRK